MQELDIGRLGAAYRSGATTPERVVADVLDRIAARGDDGVWITLVEREAALARARVLAESGLTDSPLWGVPFAVKDNIDVAGMPTTAGCPAFAYTASTTATAVRRLLDAGAILIGKTNLDQFATGLVGVRSPYGVARNPFDPAYVPGGSSSGSAVAVSAGLVSFALGTDTAGSGRVPAGFLNVVGLKPTRGAVSTAGVVPACRTLDCVSVFALTSDDAHAAYRVMAAPDPADPFSRPVEAPPPGAMAPLVRLGVPAPGERVFCGDVEAERCFEAALRLARRIGAEIVEVPFAPFYEAARLLYEGPWVAERLAALRAFVDQRADAMLPVTRAIVEGARGRTAVEAFEAAYRLADLARETAGVWSGVDALIVPTSPTIYTIAAVEADPITLNSNLGTYTNFVNLLDLCGLAVPAGMRGDGLPSGVTLLAPAGRDGVLAEIGARLHAASGLTLGATGWSQPPEAPRPRRAGPGAIELAVVGAHMSGMPLNGELLDRGGVLLRTVRTEPRYRLFALCGTEPARPGLLRTGSGDGAAIETEVWALPPAGFAAFVAAVPAPLSIGTLDLADGTSVKGFLVEAAGVGDAVDVSGFGGWRSYTAAVKARPSVSAVR